MRKITFLFVLTVIVSCTNSLTDSVQKYLMTLSDIYGGKITVKQRKYLNSNEKETIISLSNCSYVDYGWILPEGTANNCAIELYTKYGSEIGRLSIDAVSYTHLTLPTIYSV